VKKRIKKASHGETWTQEKRRAEGKTVIASFSLHPTIAALIGVLAKRLDVSRSEVVRRGIDALWCQIDETGLSHSR
jgi:hypothetical protein